MNIDKLIEETSRILESREELRTLVSEHEDIIIIGNGGSNSIASHISQDYTKALGKRAISFSDPSRLTCYINDYGSDVAYVQFLKEFSNKHTLVILISSSGQSMNIVNAGKYCDDKGLTWVALSGFSKDNELRRLKPALDFWVNSRDYGIVECTHQAYLHSIIGDD